MASARPSRKTRWRSKPCGVTSLTSPAKPPGGRATSAPSPSMRTRIFRKPVGPPEWIQPPRQGSEQRRLLEPRQEEEPGSRREDEDLPGEAHRRARGPLEGRAPEPRPPWKPAEPALGRHAPDPSPDQVLRIEAHAAPLGERLE